MDNNGYDIAFRLCYNHLLNIKNQLLRASDYKGNITQESYRNSTEIYKGAEFTDGQVIIIFKNSV